MEICPSEDELASKEAWCFMSKSNNDSICEVVSSGLIAEARVDGVADVSGRGRD